MTKIIHYGIGKLDKNIVPEGLKISWRVTWNVAIIDRTKTLEYPFDYDVLRPIPEVDKSFNKSFEQVSLERAEGIWRASDLGLRDVCVYWSGGIDSTVALVALIRTATPERLERLVVRYSHMSIAEYSLFYNKFVKGKLRTEDIGYSIAKYKTDRINVTGELGDQLFGSTMMYPYQIKDFSELYSSNWKDHLETLFQFFKEPTSNISSFIDYIEPLVAKAPFEIKTPRDLFWWINFSCKWQDVQVRMMRGIEISRKDFDESLWHFFDSHDYQQWSMNEDNHYKFKLGNDWKSYKSIAKKFIYDFTGDEQYYKEKLKVGSLKVNPNYTYKFRYDDMTTEQQ